MLYECQRLEFKEDNIAVGYMEPGWTGARGAVLTWFQRRSGEFSSAAHDVFVLRHADGQRLATRHLRRSQGGL